MSDLEKELRRREMRDALEDATDELAKGLVVDLLPNGCNGHVAIGLSVAVGALRDGNNEVAKAALEQVVAELENEISE